MKKLVFVIVTCLLLFIISCEKKGSKVMTTMTITNTITTTQTTTTLDISDIEYKEPTKKFGLNSLISNGMMFQQEKPIRIFGKAEPDTIIIAKLLKNGDSNYIKMGYTIVPESGKWLLELEGEIASFQEYTLEITDTIHKEVINNVLFGDIWIAAGQSNMALKLMDIVDKDEYYRNVNEDYIRIFYQADLATNANYPYEPLDDVYNGYWKVANTIDNIKESSAIGYIFGVELFYRLYSQGKNIPIGIINTARGGSSIHAWLARDVVTSIPQLISRLDSLGIPYDDTNWNGRSSNNYNQVSALYNTRIAPLTNFNIKGVLWYQGENDPIYEPNIYAIPALIDSWSQGFNRSDELLPFALIQLHPYDGTDPFAGPSEKNYITEGYAAHRQAQFEVVRQEKYRDTTVVIPIYDVDLTWQVIPKFAYESVIHPLVKAPIGIRTAKAILTLVYGYEVDYLPPIYKAHTYDDHTITIEFEHYGSNLRTLDGEFYVKTVEVHLKNGKRLTVSARIEKPNKIIISDIDTSTVEAISYSYLTRNEESNLCSSLGVPAIPFKVNLRD